MKPMGTFILCLSTFLAGGGPLPGQSDITAARDAFFSNGIIPRLKIELDAEALSSLGQHPRKNVKATVREGDKAYREIAVHLKGETSFEPIDQKPSFTLNLDKFVPNQTLHGLDKIHLNNSTQDKSLLSEYLGSALFRAAGYPAARVSHARVQLNERDLGLYVLVEGYNKNFLRRHFKNPDGNFYDAPSGQDINNALDKTSGDGPDDHADVKVLKEAVYERDRAKRMEKLKELLWLPEEHSEVSGVPSFYTFVATEILAGHWDGYSLHRNNYRLYHEPESPSPFLGGASSTSPAGRFVFIPSGMDQLFVYPRGSLQPDCMGRVAATLLDTGDGRRFLRQRLEELSRSVFRRDAVLGLFDHAAARLKSVVAELEPKTQTAHEKAVTTLRQRIDERLAFLESEISRKPLTLQFDSNGCAPIGGWVPHVDLGIASLYQTNSPSEPPRGELHEPLSSRSASLLVIHCRGREMPTIASWRTRVSLPKGRYRLEGRLKTTGLRPLPNAPGGGVGIRVFGEPPPTATATAKDGWQTFSTEFSALRDGEQREILCEARAFLGVVSFDVNSVKVVRVGE